MEYKEVIETAPKTNHIKKDSIKELQNERLNAKKKEIVSRQNALEIYWQNNKDKPLVEKNAINELLILMQLKSEIEELKNYLKML